jgi:pyrimidine deaminase RibD-like protein
MDLALALASAQAGRTAPNPSVGCVVVRAGEVLAQAATGDGGRPHAEEQALAACIAAGADVFVTLEPCHARSAGGLSCTDLLLAAHPARVVIASADPHPLANGAGVARLQAAGIAVVWALRDDALALNAAFFASVSPC